MGVALDWQYSVIKALQDIGLTLVPVADQTYNILLCKDKIALNLISLDNNYKAEELIALQDAYKEKNIQLVQLWADVWQTRQDQVISRIKSILGLNIREYGRNAIVKTLDQVQADDFLNSNHIQGSAKSRYKFALEIDKKIVALACFSNARVMKSTSKSYRSFELIRFATLKGITVTGGFTKLLKHFIKIVEPNDVMSYADRDWSLGNAYEQAGFTLVNITPPSQICLAKDALIRFFPHRLPPQDNPASNDEYLAIFNTGNLKYILYL